jgi:hypothetical protein
MKSRSTQDVGDAPLAEHREVRLEVPHEQADELRILVDGHGNLDERVRTFFVEALVPMRDREGTHEKARSSLSLRPAASGVQLKNGEPSTGG